MVSSAWTLMVGFCGSTVAKDLVILCVAVVNHSCFSTYYHFVLVPDYLSVFRSSV